MNVASSLQYLCAALSPLSYPEAQSLRPMGQPARLTSLTLACSS